MSIENKQGLCLKMHSHKYLWQVKPQQQGRFGSYSDAVVECGPNLAFLPVAVIWLALKSNTFEEESFKKPEIHVMQDVQMSKSPAD